MKRNSTPSIRRLSRCLDTSRALENDVPILPPRSDGRRSLKQVNTPESRTMNGEVRRGKWNDPSQNNAYIADLEYPTMSIDEICALKVPAADDSHCYIWTINRYIEQTYAVALAWGFEPSTMLYWLKQPMGLGLGGAFVPCVEPILFCRRGKLPVKSRCDRNWWGWPRGRHSAKPEEFQTVVESVSPGPYLELFARRKRHGWSSWGNEIESDVKILG